MINTPKSTHRKCNKLVCWLEVFALTFIIWLIMSGRFETKFILFGLASCFLIATLCIRVLIVGGLKTENTYFLLNFNLIRMIPYAFWLFKEIVKSSLHVSRAVINPDMVDASVLWFKADYDNPLARAVLANSITLTPGTITIDIFEDGIYSVNAVTKASRDELLDGTMQHKVAWVFGEEIDYKVLGVEDKDENERGE